MDSIDAILDDDEEMTKKWISFFEKLSTISRSVGRWWTKCVQVRLNTSPPPAPTHDAKNAPPAPTHDAKNVPLALTHNTATAPTHNAETDPPTPTPTHHTPQEGVETMDTTPIPALTFTSALNLPLNEALKQKLILKKKWLKATHHVQFLGNCIETSRVPKGLRLQYSEIHLMEALHTGKTRSAIARAYKQAEVDICKALQEHYIDIAAQTERQLEEVDKHIHHHLEKDLLDTQDAYNVFVSRLERT